MTRSHWIKSIVFLIILFLLIVGIDRAMTYALRQYNLGAGFDVWNDIVNSRASAQTIILGSSRALIDIDCAPITTQTGKSCYNLGFDGTHINLQLARYKLYLKYNKQPSTLVVVFGSSDFEDGEIFAPYQYVPYVNEDVIFKALVDVDKNYWLYRYVPLYGYMMHHDMLLPRVIKVIMGDMRQEKDWGKQVRVNGFLSIDRQWTDHFEKFKRMYPNGKVFDIKPKAIGYYHELLTMSKQMGSKVILVYAPIYYEATFKYTANYAAIIKVIEGLASAYQLPFYNYADLPMNKDTKYFYNSQHLNAQGAKIFSSIIAKDINNELNR